MQDLPILKITFERRERSIGVTKKRGRCGVKSILNEHLASFFCNAYASAAAQKQKKPQLCGNLLNLGYCFDPENSNTLFIKRGRIGLWKSPLGNNPSKQLPSRRAKRAGEKTSGPLCSPFPFLVLLGKQQIRWLIPSSASSRHCLSPRHSFIQYNQFCKRNGTVFPYFIF